VAVTDMIVVGGGIAGLAAADRLARSGLDVTLLEAADRLGGKVHTVSFAGRPLDIGAEALVARDATAFDLCRELSLEGDLVTPACSRAHVWTRRGRPPRRWHAARRGTDRRPPRSAPGGCER